MGRDERLELRGDGRVTTEREVRLDPVLERRHAELVETSGLGLRKGLEGQVGERRTTPERQGLTQELRRALGALLRERTLALGEQALEPRQVEVAVPDPELVSAAGGHENRGGIALGATVFEHLAEPGDVHTNALHGSVGRALAPECIDQAVDRDGLVHVQQEYRENGARLGSPEGERASVCEDLEWPEDAEIHHSVLAIASVAPGPAARTSGFRRTASGC